MATPAFSQATLDLQQKALAAAGAEQDAAAKVQTDTGAVFDAQKTLDAAKSQLASDNTSLTTAKSADNGATLAWLQAACVDLGVDLPLTIPAPTPAPQPPAA